jgi:aminopeptidase N
MGNQLSNSIQILTFGETEVPWKCKQKCQLGILYAGMENTSATIFSRRYVVDSIFQDRAYTNVDAHELAHQWWRFDNC